MEWHRFPWQLCESNQQGGQYRPGDRAKPYSLSTCLLWTASQLAVFAFQVFGEFMKSVFFKPCLFSLPLSLFLQLQAPWMEGLFTVVKSFGPAEDDAVTLEQDGKSPPISLHAYAAPQGLRWDLWRRKTNIKICCLYKQACLVLYRSGMIRWCDVICQKLFGNYFDNIHTHRHFSLSYIHNSKLSLNQTKLTFKNVAAEKIANCNVFFTIL